MRWPLNLFALFLFIHLAKVKVFNKNSYKAFRTSEYVPVGQTTRLYPIPSCAEGISVGDVGQCYVY